VKQGSSVKGSRVCVKTGTGKSLIKIVLKNAEKDRHKAVIGSE
jgi:hypothetical protein